MITLDDDALEDLDRIFDFNFSRDPATALAHFETIVDALKVLARHREIGRNAGGTPPMRELIISHGITGYIALYEYSPLDGLIRVAAIRHQREAGYQDR